jgi:hypothetical protein
VLPFRPAFFEPAVRAEVPVTASAIGYSAQDVAEVQIAYWGTMTFVPHLFKTLRVRQLRVSIEFAPPSRYGNRKLAAQATWEQIDSMRRSIATDYSETFPGETDEPMCGELATANEEPILGHAANVDVT